MPECGTRTGQFLRWRSTCRASLQDQNRKKTPWCCRLTRLLTEVLCGSHRVLSTGMAVPNFSADAGRCTRNNSSLILGNSGSVLQGQLRPNPWNHRRTQHRARQLQAPQARCPEPTARRALAFRNMLIGTGDAPGTVSLAADYLGRANIGAGKGFYGCRSENLN